MSHAPQSPEPPDPATLHLNRTREALKFAMNHADKAAEELKKLLEEDAKRIARMKHLRELNDDWSTKAGHELAKGFLLGIAITAIVLGLSHGVYLLFQ